MSLLALFPHLADLRLDHVEMSDDLLTLTLAARRKTARCPRCRTRARRVHSRYTRRVADLPCAGRPVALRLRVRRFQCRNRRCVRAIFAEQFPRLVPRAGRRTHGQRALLQELGDAVGGAAGARLARTFCLPASRATVLRAVRARSRPEPPTPRVLGVDDWCQRRGQTYGTILVDLERHQPLALLPDRSAETLADWLQAHPGVEVISRDRAPAYAEGATRGAPAATQVVDRFHLVKNLSDALLQALTPYRTALAQLTPLPPAEDHRLPPQLAFTDSPSVVPSPRADPAHRARRLASYERVVALRAHGCTHAMIAQQVGVSVRTIVRWLAVREFPERRPRRRPPSPFAPYAAFLTRRWAEGCHTAMQLWREVCAEGYHGPRYHIFAVAQRLRRGEAAVPTGADGRAAPQRKGWVLTPRRVVGLVLRRSDKRSDQEHTLLTALQTTCPEAGRACVLGEQFLAILRGHHLEDLTTWRTAAADCGFTDLERFATGLERDANAVRAALTLPYSNGQTEGQVTRLKLIKRSMYGRAGLDLLEHRVLYRAMA